MRERTQNLLTARVRLYHNAFSHVFFCRLAIELIRGAHSWDEWCELSSALCCVDRSKLKIGGTYGLEQVYRAGRAFISEVISLNEVDTLN